MKKKTQSGRSMLEILAVLAIIGVLSIGGVAGFGLAGKRIQINNIIDLASKFSAKGLGGRSFKNLGSAGIDGLPGIEMRMDTSGHICVEGVSDQGPEFFSAFRAQATAYLTNARSVTIGGTTYEDCDVVLLFGRRTQ